MWLSRPRDSMLHIYSLWYILQSLLGKFYLWALMITINVSVAIWQLAICQFCSFAKMSIVSTNTTAWNLNVAFDRNCLSWNECKLSLAKFKSLAGWLSKQQICRELYFHAKIKTPSNTDVILKTHIAVFLAQLSTRGSSA